MDNDPIDYTLEQRTAQRDAEAALRYLKEDCAALTKARLAGDAFQELQLLERIDKHFADIKRAVAIEHKEH